LKIAVTQRQFIARVVDCKSALGALATAWPAFARIAMHCQDIVSHAVESALAQTFFPIPRESVQFAIFSETKIPTCATSFAGHFGNAFLPPTADQV
jgi:hypothetical protein